MKRTYIQPTLVVFQIEVSSVICVSIPINNSVPADELDAPRTRLWGNED